MINPKLFFALLIFLTISFGIVNAQDTTKKDTSKRIFVAVEQEPLFPGGVQGFYKYIAKNLKYPEVANVLGLEGKVIVSFVIEKDGSMADVKPITCLGAGCESEAARVISQSPLWKPGIQKGEPVRVMYTVPISFGFGGAKEPTYMKNLRKSNYGFVFFIKGAPYSIDDAETMLGKSFDPATIQSVEDYDNPKYAMPDKKAVYLVVMKNS
ncbi:TonB protein C-terminal [Mucilaginibacter mallensis]|uniref:TonB protein C-terminal n=1 Tax=Mucilaginibacter mallensis TaxID=652787 RepID=A0A1H2AV95_MUCMA|nr:energy transducer TonB [Mucilaginibacter mallensis]SDT49742.1 TonB protein C-terminal [Mucilaginibacter mallensis]